ncbi:MAG: efflux transporter periplasmic adaptor subunit [Sphingomonas sp. SCN 67-18]|uniref:efflux RND transporter periplasmic adaptor subunit n=1 Tax=uncultured Sphingomonas sp. TaxID=158754 RepID=UPI00086C426F|nr:efflux RND transporter periplasmic adaptor subunit [Sphingomonas sp. SCN 67-18]ODU20967.1 MAG: efflux transporter periplasmic adaptor subunit [Sphingomonas sp. SCN 67-18]
MLYSAKVRTTLLLATLLLAGCAQEAPPAPPPPEVTVVTIAPRPITNIVELPGRIQAVRTSEVRARVDGIVQRRLYEEGSDVRAGQPLFAIDPRPLRASLNAVQASLARARATAANAAQDVARYQGLVAQQAISKQEYDSAVARLRTAEADVAQAGAQVEAARLNLGYTTVTAPISGRAGRAQVTEGALVSAAGGTLLTTIEQLNPIYVNFSQSSSDLLKIRQDINAGRLNLPTLGRVEVQLVLEDGSLYGPTGHIDFLDLSIDEATGTAALRAEFPNPGRTLLPGQFVRARISAGIRPDGLTVPQRAVKLAAQGASVMVVDAKNVVAPRQIKVGDLQGSEWVVLDGLKAGDRVIVDGLQKVQPGQPVTIAKPAGRPASAQPKAAQPNAAR